MSPCDKKNFVRSNQHRLPSPSWWGGCAEMGRLLLLQPHCSQEGRLARTLQLAEHSAEAGLGSVISPEQLPARRLVLRDQFTSVGWVLCHLQLKSLK